MFFFSSFKLILHNSSKLSAFVNCLLSVMESWCLNKVKGVFFSDLLWLVDAYINKDVSWYTNVCFMKRITIDFLVLFFLNKDTWINLSKIWVKYMDYFSEWMFIIEKWLWRLNQSMEGMVKKLALAEVTDLLSDHSVQCEFMKSGQDLLLIFSLVRADNFQKNFILVSLL